MMAIFAWIWGKIGGFSLTTWGYIAAIFAILGALLKIYDAGKTAQKSADQEKVLDDVEVKNEVDTSVRTAGGDAARNDLMHNYSRD